jgi:hypothetical protein
MTEWIPTHSAMQVIDAGKHDHRTFRVDEGRGDLGSPQPIRHFCNASPFGEVCCASALATAPVTPTGALAAT